MLIITSLKRSSLRSILYKSNMDITLTETEYMHTDEEEDQEHLILDFHYEEPIHNIKTENNVMIKHNLFDADDTASDRKVVTSTSWKDVAIQHVKAEPNDKVGQISPHTENSTNYNMVFKSEPEDVLHCIKTENNEAIDQDIVQSQHVIGNEVIHISVLPENVLLAGIKNKQYCEMQRDGGRTDQINTNVEHRDVLACEGDSPKNSLWLQEARRKVRRSTTGAQHVMKTAPAPVASKTCSNVKDHACVICNKQFRNKYKLNDHVRTHSKVRPYSCDICSRSYKNKSTLIAHLKTHSVDKPYSCDVCNKAFLRKCDFRRHTATHSNVRPYSCDICSNSFKCKSILIVHLRSHSGVKPYSCDVCKKPFLRKGHLTTHVATHSNVKPYSCDICRYSFKRKASLNIHLRTHTGLKLYTCDVCNKAYPRKCDLTVHAATHCNVNHIHGDHALVK